MKRKQQEEYVSYLKSLEEEDLILILNVQVLSNRYNRRYGEDSSN